MFCLLSVLGLTHGVFQWKQISCVCVSCLTSRGMGDVGWGSPRCVIIICESPVYHLGGVSWLQVGEIYSLLEVLTLILTSVSGQELSPVPWLRSLGHAMQRGSLRSSSASWNLTVCMDPWLPWPTDNAEHLLLLPPSWSFLQDALPSHFILKTVYAANSDFSSRALPHVCVHYSQVSVLNTVVDKKCLFGYSITKTIIVFYKPWSIVVTQHLLWSIIKKKTWHRGGVNAKLNVQSTFKRRPPTSIRFRNTSLGLWGFLKET